MNGFEKHGVDHLSASSLNLWTNAPDLWVMQYLHGLRTPFNSPAPWRGICVEDAVVETLMGGSEQDAIANALAKFDQKFMLGDEKTTKERDMIQPMVHLAVEELMEFGKPEFPDGENGQEKISITAKGNDWEIPVIGFLDLVYPQHGLVIDLKTAGRLPSSMSAEHRIQRAIYAKAKNNMAVKFLYVTPKKAVMLEDGDVNETLAMVKVQITRLEAFLRAVDKDTAKAIVPLNPNSFYWGGAEELRKEFYGI
jgi:hypothetical protein